MTYLLLFCIADPQLALLRSYLVIRVLFVWACRRVLAQMTSAKPVRYRPNDDGIPQARTFLAGWVLDARSVFAATDHHLGWTNLWESELSTRKEGAPNENSAPSAILLCFQEGLNNKNERRRTREKKGAKEE